MAVQAVGTLLLFALLIAPAATAIMLTPRPALAIAMATAISVTSVWIGLAASAMFNFPPSFPYRHHCLWNLADNLADRSS